MPGSIETRFLHAPHLGHLLSSSTSHTTQSQPRPLSALGRQDVSAPSTSWSRRSNHCRRLKMGTPPGPPRRPDSWHLVAMAVPSEISSSWSTAQSWGHRDEMSARFSADVCGQWGELHHTARPLRVSDPDGAVPERPCSPYAAACALPVLPWRGSVACHPISSEHARIESTPLHAMAATT